MDCFARHRLEVAALYRGIEGFGLGRRIHTERFPDISTDLPLIAEAIDTRERIEAVLGDVDAIIDRGLSRSSTRVLAVGRRRPRRRFPRGVGDGRPADRLLRPRRAQRGRAAYRAVVDLLRREGASGATVLLGVDGIHDGARRRAGLLSRNVDVPMATIAVGAPDVLRRVLQALPDVLARPIANLERIAVVKHDGELLEPLPMVTDPDDEPPVWIALRVYTRQSAHADGGAIYTTLTRRLREAGAAGVTTLRGEWGFSSDERPFGDRFGTLASHAPTYTVFVDRPQEDRRALADRRRDHRPARRRHRRVGARVPRAGRDDRARAPHCPQHRRCRGALPQPRRITDTAGPDGGRADPVRTADRRGNLGADAHRRDRGVRRHP